MTRIVRNWWIEGQIDGRLSTLKRGPASKDGGFRLTIFQRSDKGIARAVRIDGWAGVDGELMLDVATEAEGYDGMAVQTLHADPGGQAFRVRSHR